jgi:predicted ATP-grasp superfamily ATP-dependent carboligase
VRLRPAGGARTGAGPSARALKLLLLGASVRALAASCRRSPLTRARYPGGVLALDYFADTDLQDDAAVERLAVTGGRTTAGLGRAALAVEERWDACAFTGGLENRPGLLRLLARRGTLLGADPAAVHAVRTPEVFFGFLAAERIPHARLAGDSRPGARLVKPRRAAGGRGVRPASPGEAAPPGEFLQERLPGRCGSAAFVACGRAAVLLGTSEQIAGAPPTAFRYAGSLVGPPGHFLSPAAEARLADAGSRIAARFGLRGLFGLDVVRVEGEAHVIEINPRWTASMEILEEALGLSLFDLHLQGFDGTPVRRPLFPAQRFLAKGILWADRPMTAPDPEVLRALGARDRPRRGERFLPGMPVCTLFAEGADAATCRRALAARAHDVRRRL